MIGMPDRTGTQKALHSASCAVTWPLERSRGSAGRVRSLSGARGSAQRPMAAPSSNGAIRKALRQFEDGLQTFCGQLATETAEVSALWGRLGHQRS